jgi:hypothetical protein
MAPRIPAATFSSAPGVRSLYGHRDVPFDKGDPWVSLRPTGLVGRNRLPCRVSLVRREFEDGERQATLHPFPQS